MQHVVNIVIGDMQHTAGIPRINNSRDTQESPLLQIKQHPHVVLLFFE